MDELFKQINERLPLTDAVKIGDYKEVEDLSLETITKKAEDGNTKLNGLLIYGYETKFADGTNTNGERYAKTALDKFVEDYYVNRRLNMPLTIQHYNDLTHLCGRVLVLEVNSVGFYFVCYIPKSYRYYYDVKTLISEGILQGLSKEGWSTGGKCFYKKDTGEFDYYLVESMEMTAVSLVATPANGNPLESAKEVKDALRYTNKAEEKEEKNEVGNGLEDMFN